MASMATKPCVGSVVRSLDVARSRNVSRPGVPSTWSSSVVSAPVSVTLTVRVWPLIGALTMSAPPFVSSDSPLGMSGDSV